MQLLRATIACTVEHKLCQSMALLCQLWACQVVCIRLESEICCAKRGTQCGEHYLTVHTLGCGVLRSLMRQRLTHRSGSVRILMQSRCVRFASGVVRMTASEKAVVMLML